MNLTVFGASGRTGEPLVERALSDGHGVVAFVRDPARLSVDGGDRLTVVTGDAYAAEEHVARVRASDRAWTVVRAPRLADGPAEGYRHGDLALGFAAVTRADVAAFILECVEEEMYVGEMPKVGPA